jgi:hypothetical protein
MAGFHDKSLRLLPAVPEISEAAVAKVADVEARIGRPLPAAVRDWYVREGACDILRTYSNGDPPVALEDLGRPIRHRMATLAIWLLTDCYTSATKIRASAHGPCCWTIETIQKSR